MSWRRTLIKLLVVFILPCTAITIGLLFAISNVQSLKIGPVQLLDDQYTLRATFDDVTGMLPNDNVKIAGVVVGKVEGVKIVDGRGVGHHEGPQRHQAGVGHERGGALAQPAGAAVPLPLSGQGVHDPSLRRHDRQDTLRRSTSASCSTASVRSSRPSTPNR